MRTTSNLRGSRYARAANSLLAATHRVITEAKREALNCQHEKTRICMNVMQDEAGHDEWHVREVCVSSPWCLKTLREDWR